MVELSYIKHLFPHTTIQSLFDKLHLILFSDMKQLTYVAQKPVQKLKLTTLIITL
jgi:hypothetical protein